MPRARGDDPSKSFRFPRKHYASTAEYVEDLKLAYCEWADIRRRMYESGRRVSYFYDFTKSWRIWSKQRPLLRTRTSGLVGPEPDYSVRESNLPRNWVYALFPNKELLAPDHTWGPDNAQIAEHNCHGTYSLTDDQVKRWTRVANAFGIEYEGQRGYKAPKGFLDKLGTYYNPRTGAYVRGESSLDFRQKKALRIIPSHRRSEVAKIRRAARRGVKEAVIGSIPAERLFVTRYRLSAKEMRNQWFRLDPRPSFQQFKQAVGKNITLFPKCCRQTIPGIVYRSLKRIYSNPKRVGKVWFSKPEEDLKHVLEVRLPPKEVKNRILLRKGAIVRSHQNSESYGNIYASTIPVVNRYDDHDWITWEGRTSRSAAIGRVNRTLSTDDLW